MSAKEKGKIARSNERANEYTLGKLLDSLNIWSEHMEGNGLPDRYLGKGRWIECKSFIFTRKDYWGRPPSLKHLMRDTQNRKIPKLIAAGDQVWICIFVHTEGEPTRFLLPTWDEFQSLNELQLDKQALPWRIANKDVRKYVCERLDQDFDYGRNIPAKTITITGLQDAAE